MFNTHIITYSDINSLARPCAADDDVIEKFIAEAERNDLRLQMGDETFILVMKAVQDGESTYDELLNGGEFTDKCGNTRCFEGLRRTLAYYAYGRLVRNGSNFQTRFGFVEKRDEYSQNSDFKYRMQAYNDAFQIADEYMRQCLDYMAANPVLFPAYANKCNKGMINNRVRFFTIGD